MDPSSSRQPTGDRSDRSDRSDLLRNAVLFLTDPKVQSSTLASKIGFLESKGLTEGEIQDALRQASTSVRAVDDGGGVRGQGEFATRGYATGTGYAAGYGTGYGVMPPEPPRRDWRDLFVSAVYDPRRVSPSVSHLPAREADRLGLDPRGLPRLESE
jgi:peroxin-14